MKTATTVRERSIIFGKDSVRAILEGRKSQTRRVVKPQPSAWIDRFERSASPDHWLPSGVFIKDPSGMLNGKPLSVRSNDKPLRCPFGRVGEALWVRESFATAVKARCQIAYAADGEWHSIDANRIHVFQGYITGFTDKVINDWQDRTGRWVGRSYFHSFRPSIHMPRWASRITLEITGVRVERLQAMSREDVMAEGVAQVEPGPCYWFGEISGSAKVCHATPEMAFRRQWDAINPKHPWASNPWIWVLEFKRL